MPRNAAYSIDILLGLPEISVILAETPSGISALSRPFSSLATSLLFELRQDPIFGFEHGNIGAGAMSLQVTVFELASGTPLLWK